jgi:hypothetical protein
MVPVTGHNLLFLSKKPVTGLDLHFLLSQRKKKIEEGTSAYTGASKCPPDTCM